MSFFNNSIVDANSMIASFLKWIGKAQACCWWADGRPLLIGYICTGVHGFPNIVKGMFDGVRVLYRTSSHVRERMMLVWVSLRSSVWGLGGLH